MVPPPGKLFNSCRRDFSSSEANAINSDLNKRDMKPFQYDCNCLSNGLLISGTSWPNSVSLQMLSHAYSGSTTNALVLQLWNHLSYIQRCSVDENRSDRHIRTYMCRHNTHDSLTDDPFRWCVSFNRR